MRRDRRILYGTTADARLTQEIRAMSETKPTPGPWRRVANRHTGQNTTVGSGDFGAIAETGGCRPDWTENEANAALIAAAPALRDALDQLHGWLERHADAGGETPPDDLMDEARAALAAAKGNA